MKEGHNTSICKDRNFIIIYAAYFISGLGDSISKIALLWFTFKLTNSATTMGVVFACLTMPGIFAGLLAGTLADRYSKRKIFITARIALGIIAVGFIPAFHYRSIELIYLLAFLSGTAFSFDGGPLRAYLPEIFAKNKLSKINAAITSARSLTMMIGPAIGGIIVAAGNVRPAFLLDAATFFISALLLGFLPAALPRMAEGSIKIRTIFHDIKSGISYIFNSPLHRFLMFFFVSLLGMYCLAGGLVTPLCKIVLADYNGLKGSTALSIIQAAFGFGGLTSVFFIPGIMRKYGYLRTLMAGAALCAVELLAFGYVSNIIFLTAIIVFTAASGPLLMVPLFTFLQEKTEARLMGRAIGALDTLILTVVSLALGIGGILGDIMGIRRVFIITGFAILTAFITIPFLPIYKRVKRLEKQSPGKTGN